MNTEEGDKWEYIEDAIRKALESKEPLETAKNMQKAIENLAVAFLG